MHWGQRSNTQKHTCSDFIRTELVPVTKEYQRAPAKFCNFLPQSPELVSNSKAQLRSHSTFLKRLLQSAHLRQRKAPLFPVLRWVRFHCTCCPNSHTHTHTHTDTHTQAHTHTQTDTHTTHTPHTDTHTHTPAARTRPAGDSDNRSHK